MKKKILFVCIENSNRSQMAEAFARIRGADLVEPYSAGSKPSGGINRRAVEAMGEVGYDLTQHRSKSLTEIPDVEYDYVITMGCGDECPYVRTKNREEWNIPDPTGMLEKQFREVRDNIAAKVENLLKRIGSS